MTHYFPGKICSAPELITEGEEDGKREWGRSRTKEVSSEAESEQPQSSSSTNEASSHSPVSDNISSSVPSTVTTISPSISTAPSISVSTPTVSTTSSHSTTASKENPDCVSNTLQGSSQTPKNPPTFSKMPNMIPKPGTEVRFTKFPAKPYKDGATPSEVTQHCLDSTYSVRCMLEGLERWVI